MSKETISRITGKVIEELNDWAVRPLEFAIARLYYTKIAELWTADAVNSVRVHQPEHRQLIVEVDRLLAALSSSSNAVCMQSA
jgi:hypothetical protein